LKKLVYIVVSILVFSIIFSGMALGEDKISFPKKPVILVVPWAAGGMVDLLGRTIAEVLPKYLGQPLVIVNQPGAGGTVAVTEITKEKPDGYSLCFSATGPFSTQPWIHDIQYDPESDFTSICGCNFAPCVLAVKSDSQWDTFEEFVNYGQKNNINFGVSGSGSVHHLAGAAIFSGNDVNYDVIPFEGGANAVTALMGGHIDSVVVLPPEVVSGYESGRFKLLGVTSEERDSTLPDIPTFKELGYNYVFGPLVGIVGPKGIPEEVVDILQDALSKTFKDEEFIRLAKNGNLNANYLSGEKFKERYISDYYAYGKVIKELGLAK